MVTKQTDHVAWALLMYELADAQEGLKSLCQEMAEDTEFDETAFRIHVAHIYSHLNRAWNGRNATAESHDDNALWDKWAGFPTDIEPLKPF